MLQHKKENGERWKNQKKRLTVSFQNVRYNQGESCPGSEGRQCVEGESNKLYQMVLLVFQMLY